MSEVSQCKPYGDPSRAKLFIIGHDPRLQRSDTETKHVFFLDLLESPPPQASPERAKYSLARSTIEYIMLLIGWRLPITEMYFTNLCNEFLEHAPKGQTVLIPNDVADRGIKDIDYAIKKGAPRLILPMSLQVFYHLARTNFVPNTDLRIQVFLEKAKPNKKHRQRKAYKESGKAPFLDVCGDVFYHSNIPVVPILHVKSWARVTPKSAYFGPMNNAIKNIAKMFAE